MMRREALAGKRTERLGQQAVTTHGTTTLAATKQEKTSLMPTKAAKQHAKEQMHKPRHPALWFEQLDP
jgi:hypothetical protein